MREFLQYDKEKLKKYNLLRVSALSVNWVFKTLEKPQAEGGIQPALYVQGLG